MIGDNRGASSEMVTAELARCPFDGDGHRHLPLVSSWLIGTAAELQVAEDQYLFTVRCLCGAQGPECPSHDEAVAAWSARTPTSPVTDGASLSGEVRPFCYAYRYPAFPPAGATVIRFGTNGREINGSKPIEAIPLYARPPEPSSEHPLSEEVERVARQLQYEDTKRRYGRDVADRIVWEEEPEYVRAVFCARAKDAIAAMSSPSRDGSEALAGRCNCCKRTFGNHHPDCPYTFPLGDGSEGITDASLAQQPCETKGNEDAESGCCAPCRARAAMIQASPGLSGDEVELREALNGLKKADARGGLGFDAHDAIRKAIEVLTALGSK